MQYEALLYDTFREWLKTCEILCVCTNSQEKVKLIVNAHTVGCSELKIVPMFKIRMFFLPYDYWSCIGHDIGERHFPCGPILLYAEISTSNSDGRDVSRASTQAAKISIPSDIVPNITTASGATIATPPTNTKCELYLKKIFANRLY